MSDAGRSQSVAHVVNAGTGKCLADCGHPDHQGRRQTAAAARCGVCSDVPEAHCARPAAYAARWENGDEQDLCVEHAAWVRGHSGDLVVMRSLADEDRP